MNTITTHNILYPKSGAYLAKGLFWSGTVFGLLLLLFLSISFTLSAQSDKTAINAIEFNGNSTYPKIILQNYIYTQKANFIQRTLKKREDDQFLNRVELENDVRRLQQFYRQRGFPKAIIDVRVATTKESSLADVEFIIKEGSPQIITSFSLFIDSNAEDSSIILSYPPFLEKLKRHAYRQGQKFEPILEAEVKANLLDPLSRFGYPFASIRFETDHSEDQEEVAITAILKVGRQRTIHAYKVSGNDRMEKDYILKEAELRTGILYDERKIERGQKELFNHPMVRFVTMSVEPSEEEKDEASVLINIRERKIRTIQLTGGLGIEETLRGQINWIHRDFLNTGHQFNTEATASFIEQRISSSYQIPWLFNTHSSLVVSPFVQNMLEPGFTLFRGGISNTFIYQTSTNFTGTFAYNLTRNRERLTQTNISLPDSIQSYDIASINAGVLFSSGYVKDRKGWVIRANNELSGLLFDATYPFQRLSVDIRHYKPAPWAGGQLAFKIEGGRMLSSVAQDSIPRNLRFFLGGTSSIRGWNRQQLGPKDIRFENDNFLGFAPKGGRSMLAFSVEVRQDLPFIFKGFGIAGFLDGGNIWADRINTQVDPIRFGTGFGLRYDSPIGPLRVDFGYKVNPSDTDRGIFEGVQYTEGNRWALHFSLGQAF